MKKMNKKQKSLQLAAIAYFIAAFGFYLWAIIGFVESSSMAFTGLLLGSAFLCLGATMLNRLKATESDAADADGKTDGENAE